MNLIRTLAGIFIVNVFLSSSTDIWVQTAGKLTFSCNTTAPSGTWGNKHVLAVWIENAQSPSVFIKTKSKYGNEDDHLTSWVPKSGKNVVDAVTGATLTSYGNQTVIWNGTNVNNVVVADGTYNVFIEMGWGQDKVAQHSVMSFSFTKSNTSVHLTPAGNSYYSAVSIDWVPTVTLINSVFNPDMVSVFPNPTKGIINLRFSDNLNFSRVYVENPVGVTVVQKKIAPQNNGEMDIDLSSYSNGMYFVKVMTSDNQFIYKVLVNK